MAGSSADDPGRSGTGDGPAADPADPASNGAGRIERLGGPRRVLLYAVLGLAVVLYLAPLHGGLMTSFKTPRAFAETASYMPPPPSEFVTRAWGDAWGRLDHAMLNSLLFVVPATVLSAFLGSLAAFGLTKIDWRGQIAILLLFLAGVFIPYQSVLVPLRLFWSAVNVQGSLLAIAAQVSALPVLPDVLRSVAVRSDLVELALTHTAYGIPITTILFRGYYLTIDTEIVEAAKIDGASTTRIYRRIVLPLSKPMFAVTLIYQFTNIWNDLLFALVLVTSSESHVATQALAQLQGSMVQDYALQMAGAFIVALPTLVIYVIFGKQFAEGITGAGA